MPFARGRTRGPFGRPTASAARTPAAIAAWGAIALGLGGQARAQGPAGPPAPAPYETVVTAAAPAQEPREDHAAAASVVLPGQSLRAKDDLGELLLEVPGVTVTRSGGLGDFSTVAIRGSNPDEVRIYLDGVPMNIAAGGSVDLSTLPLGDVERIEVYRGTSPIVFGESALGGIIAISTRTPGTRHASVRAGSGSFRTLFGDATAGGSIGRLRLYAGVHTLRAQNNFFYLDDRSTTFVPTDDRRRARDNNQLGQLDGVARAALTLAGRRELGLGLLGLWRRHDLPGRGFEENINASFQTRRGVAYLSYESRDDLGANSRLRAQLFVAALRNNARDPDGKIGGIPVLTRDTIIATGSTLTAAKTAASWLRLTAVAQGRRETFAPVNEAEPTPAGVPAERLAGAAGVELDLYVRRLALDIIPSARVELVRDVVTGRDPLFARQRPASEPITRALPVLRLALVRPLASWVSLKANVGRYARVPSFNELYGDAGRLLGNPDLRPEVGWNADAGASFQAMGRWVSLDARVALFGARVEDLIEWVRTSPGQMRAGNVSRARVWGAENELRLGVGRSFRLTGQATFSEARDAGDVAARRGRLLPAHPRWRGYLRPELHRHFQWAGLAAGAFVDGDASAGAYMDTNNLNAVEPRLLIGAGLLLDVVRAGLRLAISARNLTDVRTNDIPYYPLPGRSVFLSLTWTNHGPGAGNTNQNLNKE
jgi:outer membrane cobalamin receptor